MSSCTVPRRAGALRALNHLRAPRALRDALACWGLAAALAPLAASAQQPGNVTGALPPDMMKQLEASGAPIGDSMARLKRMTDPNAGRREGDEKLSCDQIRAELVETKKKYDAQQTRYDAMVDAKNASTERYVTATTGVAAQAGQLARGALVGLTVGVFGTDEQRLAAGKAAVAPELAMRDQQIKEADELGATGEVLKSHHNRGTALVALGKTKACKDVSLTP